MSKWNKQAKPPSQQFLQNEERRRQMIIEASKKRREREKKLQEINENMKRNQQQALQRIKREKQEAYNKYLKNNMHDKYEEIKRNQKMQEEPKRDVSKWKKRQKSQTKVASTIDYESQPKKANVDASPKLITKEEKEQIKKGLESKQAVAKQFEKQWADDSEEIEEQMLGSKLLDSLDLDIDTICRGKEINHRVQEIAKKNSELDEVKNLIGYDSMLVSNDNYTNYTTKLKSQQIEPEPMKQQKVDKRDKKLQGLNKKEINQQEMFNHLKHKKQAKILEWASNETEEADDLFSNCSSKKNPTISKPIAENKGSRKQLETIPEKTSEKSCPITKQAQRASKNDNPPKPNFPNFQKKVNRSVENTRNTASQQNINTGQRTAFAQPQNESIGRPRNKSINQQNRSYSRQKPTQQQSQQKKDNAFLKQKQRSLQKIRQRKFSGQRSGSAQKARPKEQQRAPKTQQPFRINKNPHVPAIPKPTYTVATHEQFMDVQSFIKNDLMHLNEEQRKVQEQIRNLHLGNKEKVKEVYSKYEIKTNYGSSKRLIRKQETEDMEESQVQAGGYAHQWGNLNQESIEDSVQRLDDLLIKRELNSREKTVNQEESNLKSNYKSIIDPLSRPEDLHKQILQLASNISKFENQPEPDLKGYGYQRKMKKPGNKPEPIPEEILSVSRNMENVSKPRSSCQGALKMPQPPILEYSGRDSELIEVDLEEKYYHPEEDSLETTPKEKIKVNDKFKNLLFD